MRIIEPSVEIIEHGETLDDLLRHIESCGRVCYKSEAKIKNGSAEKFVGGLIRRGHEAVLEHGTLIVAVVKYVYEDMKHYADAMSSTYQPCYLRFTSEYNGLNIISGNVRAWRDYIKYMLTRTPILPVYLYNFLCANAFLFPEVEYDSAKFWGRFEENSLFQIHESDLKTEREILTHKNITVKWICDRGVTHEIVRHRPASYCQESTRYCNYSKDDFGNEITVIKPFWMEEDSHEFRVWRAGCVMTERAYRDLLELGQTPQQARAVLPNSLKTELMMTANVQEWKHFLELRNSKFAHPQMEEVAAMLDRAFKEKYPDIFH